jgi:hypothetical protein
MRRQVPPARHLKPGATPTGKENRAQQSVTYEYEYFTGN